MANLEVTLSTFGGDGDLGNFKIVGDIAATHHFDYKAERILCALCLDRL